MLVQNSTLKVFAFCLIQPIFMAQFACSSDSYGADNLPPLNDTPIPSVLGSDGTTCDVDSQPQSLSICDYSMSVDTIVFGQITDVQLVRSPAKISLSNTGYTDEEGCDGMLVPGLKLTMAVDTSTTDIDARELDIYIGSLQLNKWLVVPFDETDGRINWYGVNGITDEAKLAVGQYLGFPISFHEEDNLWGLTGERLIQITDPGSDNPTMSFQELGGSSDSCGSLDYPDSAVGLTISEFVEQSLQCEPTERSEERKNTMYNYWSQTKDGYMAARCHPNNDPAQQP